MKKKIIAGVLAAVCLLTLAAGCGEKNTSKGHETITFCAPMRDVNAFVAKVHEKYPEIVLEPIPYSGGNGTAFMQAQLATGDLPDIYFTSVYTPGLEDLSDRLIDLSAYPFVDNYVTARLREVTVDGAIYMLPSYFTCLGITYNKTLLEKNGWTLPASLKELEELAPQVEAAGYRLCLDQLQFPGFGFQYLCNIMDTGYFSTMEGRQWQKEYLSGEANLEDSAEMAACLQTLERWRDIGMLNAEGGISNDGEVKLEMAKGETLFMLGTQNNFSEEEGVTDEFGLMPYLSEDGDQNVYIMNVSRYVGLSKRLEDAGNEQKLEDALHVMEVLTTDEGLWALNQQLGDTMFSPLKDGTVPNTSYYNDVMDSLNGGYTAPFIYAGWENVIVPVGNKMVEYIQGKAEIEDVAACIDNSQELLFELQSYTTVTEKLETEDCARLVGISFTEAVDADGALVSMTKWLPDAEGTNFNSHGVNGALYPLAVTDQELTSVLPTGWRGTIETVTLTGAQIKALAEAGFDLYSDGTHLFPYLLVMRDDKEPEDDRTYTMVICGADETTRAEGQITDTGVLGLDAARDFVGRSETLSKANLIWE